MPRYLLGLASSLLSFALVGAVFAAPAVAADPTLTVSAPATAPLDTNFVVTLEYNLPAGNYEPLQLSLDLPVVTPAPESYLVTYVASAAPGATFVHSEPTPGHHVWTATLSQGAAATGQIFVTLKLPGGFTLDGTPVHFEGRLSAAFTPTGGSPLSFQTPLRTADLVAVGAASFAFQDAGVRGLATWSTDPTTGKTGYLYRIDFRVRNLGPAGVPTYDFSVSLGSALKFVQAFTRRNNDAVPIVPAETQYMTIDASSLPAAWSSGATTPITATGLIPLRALSGPTYSAHLHVDLFIPCDAIPVNPGDAAYRVVATVTGHQPQHGGGTISLPISATLLPPQGSQAQGCGTGGGLTKSAALNTYGVGSPHYYALNFAAPNAVFPFHDLLIVDQVYPGITGATIGNVHPDMTNYFCSATFGEYFDVATFLGYVDDGTCVTAFGALPGPLTHWVMYGALVGATGFGGTSPYAYFDVPSDFLDGKSPIPYPVVDVAYANGVADLDLDGDTEAFGDLLPETVPGSDPWEYSVAAQVVPGSIPGLEEYSYAISPAAPRVLGLGHSSEFWMRAFVASTYSERPVNPTITIDPPPGVIIESATPTYYTGGGCDPNPVDVTTPQLTDDPLSWTFGSAANPYRLTYYCIVMKVRFKVDPAFPHPDLGHLDFVGTIVGENQRANQVPGRAVTSFQLTVPAEMNVRVEPGCDEENGPFFTVTSENTGGVALVGATTSFIIPRIGDAAGSTADSVYAGLVGALPPGALAQVFVGGSWVDATGHEGDTQVTAARVTGYTLGVGDPPFSYVVSLTTAATPGDALYAAASMEAPQLTTAATASQSLPYIAGQCPGRIGIVKFFDADQDGVEDVGEARLDGWSFVVTDSLGAETALTTAGGGVAGVVVLPGTYTVTEGPPPEATAGTWDTPVGGLTRTVIIGSGDEVTVAFGNHCTCPAAGTCQAATCNPNGSCTVGPAPEGTSCDDGEFCTSDDGCHAGACTGTPGTTSCGAAAPLCDEASDGCVECLSASDCAAALPQCAAATCVSGVCGSEGVTGGSCDDGVACTEGDSCAAGACVGTANDALCSDGDACTADSCGAAGCVFTAVPPDTTLHGWVDDDDATQSFLPVNGAGDLLTTATAAPAGLSSGVYLDWAFSFNASTLGAQVGGVTTVEELQALLGTGACSSWTSTLTPVVNVPPCDPSGVNAYTLGAAGDAALGLNLIACDGGYSGGRDVEGAVATVKRLAPAQGFSVGLGVDGVAPYAAYAGDIVAESGTFYGPVVTVDDTNAIAADVDFAGAGPPEQGDPLDLPYLCEDLRAVSLALCAATSVAAETAPDQLPDTGWWGEVTLTATAPGTNVFTVDAADIAGATTFVVDNAGGANASVVANVVSPAGNGVVQFERGEVQLRGITSDRVLFNFCGATEIHVRGSFGGGAYGFYAGILAPFAALDFSYGQIVGLVVVASMTGDAELHLAPFTSTLTVESSCDAAPPGAP